MKKIIVLSLVQINLLWCMSEFDKPIIAFLKNYKREFTTLVLGENSIVIGKIIANNFSNSSVIVINKDKDTTSIKEFPNNVCLLSFDYNTPNIHILSECEHFDIILLSSKSLNYELINILTSMSDYIFLNVPTMKLITFFKQYEKNIIFQYENNNTVGSMGNTEYFFKTNNNNILKKRSLIWPPAGPYRKKIYTIISDFEQKYLKKCFVEDPTRITCTPWTKGINLLTYLFFNGVIPSRKFLKNKLIEMCDDTQFRCHNDLSPANLIVDGTSIKYIDFADGTINNEIFERKFRFIEEIIDTNITLNLPQFYDYYWTKSATRSFHFDLVN